MLPVLTRPRGLRKETRVGAAAVAEFMSLRTSERVSVLPSLEESAAVVEVDAATDADWESLDRNRLAHDLGAAGAEAGLSVASDGVDGSATPATEEEVSCPSSATDFAVSDDLDTCEAIESRCAFRPAVGLGGRIGTAGMIGPNGRAFGWVGVDLVADAGTAEDGVVGCVEAASDTASEGTGVEV